MVDSYKKQDSMGMKNKNMIFTKDICINQSS